MLQYHLERLDHVASKDDLCMHVWPGQFIRNATLEGCIALARRAIGDSGRMRRFIDLAVLRAIGADMSLSVSSRRTANMRLLMAS